MGLTPLLRGADRQTEILHTAMFGKFARPQMRVLYRKLYRKFYAPSIESREVAILKWWIANLKELNPRVLRAVSKFQDFVIYPDAASAHFRLAALLFRGGQRGTPSFFARLLLRPLNSGGPHSSVPTSFLV